MDNTSYAGRLGHIPRPRRGPPPGIWNPRPAYFAFPPSTSLLESLFPHNPILSTVIGYLTTPALLALYCTCHTLRYYLRGQRRYFRNLLLIPDLEAEKWDEPQETKIAVKRSAVADPALLWTMKLRDLVSKENRRIDPVERVKIVKGYMWDFVKGDPVLPLVFKTSKVDWMVWLTMRESRDPRTCFAGLMSRHLYAILTTIPVGRRLTTLVLDGTGVETDYVQHLLPQLEGTLRGLSVKGCSNIECYIWAQWLLEALEQTRPVALEWLYIWGSGNTPTTDFDTTVAPLPLEPLEPHPNDPITDFDDWNPSPSLFASVLSVDFHLRHTIQLLPAMTLSPSERQTYMASLRTVISGQHQRFLDTRIRGVTTHWVAPPFPLGEPHPVIALMAVAKYLSINLDIAFCVSLRDCYSFIHGRPTWENMNIPAQPLETEVTVVDEASGVSWPMRMRVPDEDPIPLHTHCVTEIRARRERGGTHCQNCGLWEDEMSPPKFREDGIVREYAGITWGTALGLGRTAIGYCCTDCVREMTCYGCNGFYCPACCFVPGFNWAVSPNPLAAEPAGTKFLHWTCALHKHGPYCNTCMEEEEHFFVCTDCGAHMCYLCHGPGGTTVSCALYTDDGWDADNENTRFGVVGDIGDWEEGGFYGWGGVSTHLSDDDDDTAGESGDEDMEDEPTLDGSWLPPAPSDFYPLSNQHAAVLDPEHWHRDIPQFTSDHPMAAPPPTEPEFDAPDHVSSASSCSDTSWVARLNRMSETRIWERCARCATGTCAGCLGYEEDTVSPGREHERRTDPEYRWCGGGCRRRFCDTCLNTRGGDAVDWVCGGGGGAGKYSVTVMARMAGAGGRGESGQCGACLCLECQEVLVLVAPSVGAVVGDLEEGGGGGTAEVRRRCGERRGLWMCPRCELGMRLR